MCIILVWTDEITDIDDAYIWDKLSSNIQNGLKQAVIIGLV